MVRTAGLASGTASGDAMAVEERDAAPTDPSPERAERWRRELADLDNLRKRYAGEFAYERTAERARVTAAWLPVLDDLDRTVARAGADGRSLAREVRAVRDRALAVLATLGYPRRDEVGVSFDPLRHAAVGVRPPVEGRPDTVVEVIRAGYGDGERQLRPASVLVAPGEPAAGADRPATGAEPDSGRH